MAVEERTIELTLISATDLEKVKKFGREQRCYAAAYIYPSLKKASPVDNYGGVNPTWNCKLTLTCDETLLQQPGCSIIVEILSHGSLFHSSKDKLVGTVAISLEDVIADEEQFMALPVVSETGRPHGSLNLSVKLGGKRTIDQYEAPWIPRMYSNSPSSQTNNWQK